MEHLPPARPLGLGRKELVSQPRRRPNQRPSQRQESMEQYFAAKRDDLAYAEADQITIIKEFLPEEATEEDILKCFNDVIGQDGVEPIKKNMGTIIKMIKSFLPNADGKLVAQVVQRNLQ